MFLKLGIVYFKHMSWMKMFEKFLTFKTAATLGINYWFFQKNELYKTLEQNGSKHFYLQTPIFV